MLSYREGKKAANRRCTLYFWSTEIKCYIFIGNLQDYEILQARINIISYIFITVYQQTRNRKRKNVITNVNAPLPITPSQVPDKLLGVNKENWITFSLSCSSLSRNVESRKHYHEWSSNSITISYWKECLKDITRVKESLEIHRNAKKTSIQ